MNPRLSLFEIVFKIKTKQNELHVDARKCIESPAGACEFDSTAASTCAPNEWHDP